MAGYKLTCYFLCLWVAYHHSTKILAFFCSRPISTRSTSFAQIGRQKYTKATAPTAVVESATRLYKDLWERMEIEEDDEPNWYIINCVAGVEMELLKQCRMKCEYMNDVVKFVVPTVTKMRSHGAKRMVKDIKVQYQGYVFAKLRLTKETYETIQTMGLCRSWMGTINIKGHKKLPPAPLALSQEEIENFDLENLKWEEHFAEKEEEQESDIIVDTWENELKENKIEVEIEEEVNNVYNGLRVEDMVKVTAKNKFFNEDGIVRRLKEGMVLIKFFTYGTAYDEWLDPRDVRKLNDIEVLKGLGGPTAPITQRDLDGPQRQRQDDRGTRFYNDRRNQVGLFGSSSRNRRQDRTMRRFRGDREDESRERENWNWYRENERRSRGGGYLDGDIEIRGSSDYGNDRVSSSWVEDDVDIQRVRNSSQREGTIDRRQQMAGSTSRQEGDWSPFVSKNPASQGSDMPSSDETHDFFATLISDLSNGSARDKIGDGSNGQRKNKSLYSNDDDNDDFFASLMSEISSTEEDVSTFKMKSGLSNDDDDFFTSLERDTRGSTGRETKSEKKRRNRNTEEQLDDIFASLSIEKDDSLLTSSAFVDDDDDFFASLEMELAADLEEGKETFLIDSSPSLVKQTSAGDKDSAEDDFFAALEAELDSESTMDVPHQTISNEQSNLVTNTDFDDLSIPVSLTTSSPHNEVLGDAEDGFAGAADSHVSVSFDSAPDIEKGTQFLERVDAAYLEQRTIPQLKELLRERGLKVSGKKAELIQRLTGKASSS